LVIYDLSLGADDAWRQTFFRLFQHMDYDWITDQIRKARAERDAALGEAMVGLGETIVRGVARVISLFRWRSTPRQTERFM